MNTSDWVGFGLVFLLVAFLFIFVAKFPKKSETDSFPPNCDLVKDYGEWVILKIGDSKYLFHKQSKSLVKLD
jgi:hypothetical protein